MTDQSESLVEAIDRTAFTLLQKIGGAGTMDQKASSILTEQVKAFGEIVKWATARQELVPKDEKRSDAKFTAIKDVFYADRAPRNRRVNRATEIESSPADSNGAGSAETH